MTRLFSINHRWRMLSLAAACAALMGINAACLQPRSGSNGNTQPTPAHAEYSESALSRALMQVTTAPVTEEILLEYPGYMVSFNPQFHQPNWVAWELTGDEAISTEIERPRNAFAPDPEVDSCAQLDDYRGSGWDRGHMCPAGDMKWSAEAMSACFLLTNICPQSKDLNGGAWNSLEQKCRQWAQRDSALIIICGPVLSEQLDRRIGATGIPVPNRFFKVILAPYANPPRGLAFIMPNSKVPGGMQPCAVSIDEVEALTGHDFFAALPDSLESEIESSCNFPRWSHR